LSKVTGGLDQPVYIANANDGNGRLFVVNRHGSIRIVLSGTLVITPFLNIDSRTDDESYDERGLLSMAFPPNYGSVNHFYVYYTDVNGDLVIARYGLTADPNVADFNSEQIVLKIPHPTNANHNGGQLQFGPDDGYLYLATGDGGDGGDPPNNAQNHNKLLGKMLRIDVETGSPQTYTIPSSNPFTQTAGYLPEIWSLGLRNPWRFSFDRQTHDLYIGDVGQNRYEEVDVRPANSAGGENYGWRVLEGSNCYNPSNNCIAPSAYISPVVTYDHDTGDCAIAGGYVYRGAIYPSLNGTYFFGDNCSGRIRALQNDSGQWQSILLLETGMNISSFGEDEDGNLFVADLGSNSIYEIQGLENKLYLPMILN